MSEEPSDLYPVTPRGRRQGGVPRAAPAIGGLAGLGAIFRGAGLVGGLVVLVIAVLLGLLLARALNRRTDRQMRAKEVAGCLLAAPALVQLEGGSLKDLNHRSQANIAAGQGPWPGQPAIFEAHGKAFRLRFGKTVRKRLSHDLGCRWDSIRSAEVMSWTHGRTILFLTTVTGRRWRLSLSGVHADRLTRLLREVGVPQVEPAPVRRFAIGEQIALADGQVGTVVAVSEQPDEPGRTELHVRMPDGSVDSWDSDAVAR
ncbi:MAG TPA: hypothetical protein VFJ85_09060 [Acidimicrobiales bacterium]|nr:hypothetical protein [Acidimicrobiales bacterium]